MTLASLVVATLGPIDVDKFHKEFVRASFSIAPSGVSHWRNRRIALYDRASSRGLGREPALAQPKQLAALPNGVDCCRRSLHSAGAR